MNKSKVLGFLVLWLVVFLMVLSQSWADYGYLALLLSAPFGFVFAGVAWFIGTKVVEAWERRKR